jgi:hypothetical protein
VLVVLVAAGVYGVVIFIEEVIYLQFRRLLSDLFIFIFRFFFLEKYYFTPRGRA